MAYHKHVIERVERTQGLCLGTQLGKACVKHNIPVMDVAKHLGVSRQCVYNWFFGAHTVDEQLSDKVKQYLARLDK